MKRIYKIFSLTAIITALLSLTGLSQNAWINEIHYDNFGADTNEFIEVVIQNPGSYSLADFAVLLYNGNNGALYDTKTLDLFTVGITSNGYTFYYYNYTVNGGLIQNGAPDGIALSYQTTVIDGQWLSYEGTFAAVDGPAAGLTSVDIGVAEIPPQLPNSTQSLQLSGTGSNYSEFTWQLPAAETQGQLNNNQEVMPVGIGEPAESGLSIYPNPNHGSFRLMNPFSEEMLVSIYSVYGQLVNEIRVKSGDNSIALTGASAGIYFIRFGSRDGKIISTERMVIY